MEKPTSARAMDEQEIEGARSFSLSEMLYDVTASAVTTRAGQFIYKHAENVLWTVEQTARWSLPQASPTEYQASDYKSAKDHGRYWEKETSTCSGAPLIRPMPWVLFLPTLICLRMVRSVLSMASRSIGRGPFLPSNMVGFIQNKRRKLRALKYRGQRLERKSKIESATWWKRIFLGPLKMILCIRPVDLKTSSDVEQHAVIGKNRHEINNKRYTRRETESDEDAASGNDSWEDASCQELLEKYAYVVDDSSFNVDDITSSSDCTDTSMSETDHSPEKSYIEHREKGQLQNNGKKADKIQEKSKANTKEMIKNNIKESTIHIKDSSCSSKITADTEEHKHAGTEGTEEEKLQNSEGSPVQPKNSSSTSKITIDSEEDTHAKSKDIVSPSRINLAAGSPENNENKPINQNVGTMSQQNKAASSSNSKVPSKHSSNASVSDLRNNQHQQKPTKQQSAPQLQNNTKDQSSFSNGGKNRNKKTTTTSII
ncbi:uncharacterized protein LOC125956688 isoform X2 [Anopheles darlingi]|uniref:uncharacterized protein LOC125956688 isoform X2 n=1 Tax=Anopheles darlingi TaxID=43151 RepID=UPI0021006057|nr:uncharacterized protein LOC125956688 isoform X2 [Anopheles darlingi]